MNKSNRSSRTAVTLVEVVVGLALMGTLLATTVYTSNRQLRQMRAAKLKQSAVKQIDKLLTQWSLSKFDLNHQPASSNEQFQIRIQRLSDPTLAELHCDLVRLEAVTLSENRVICMVEIVAPREDQRQ